VGEQPGDREDVEGRPFVGPAGAVLARAIERSGLDRDQVFLTNAVKHFKWEARGKRRLHKGPSRTEIAACRYWLEEELALLQPRVTVALGATAGSSLFGPAFRVGQSRGRILQAEVGGWSGTVVATIHPSAVLRAKDAAVKEELTGQLVEDLRRAGEVAAG
jgi:DNA polymerase